MDLDIAEYDNKVRTAISMFWRNRQEAANKQKAAGRMDQGSRSAVTAGKNMDGFVDLIVDIVNANGLPNATIKQKQQLLTLPGYFRPTKKWDLLVINNGRLVAAIECKSQVGSFGNNVNNRCEEALGVATDFWTAYREGAFVSIRRPFVGYVILVEDAFTSRRPVRAKSPHFPIFPEFNNASYIDRYNILCKKLMLESLYTAATLLVSPKSSITTGDYSELDECTSIKAFVATLAGHIASEAAY